MRADDRIKGRLENLHEPAPVTDDEWARFVREAHRSQRARRVGTGVTAAAFAAAVVTIALFVAPSFDRPDRPPANSVTPTPSPKQAIAFPEGWSELPPPPEVRVTAASAFTGTELLTWGGYVYTGYSDEVVAENGYTLDLETERWTELPPAPISPRAQPASVWTGSELLVWGGSADSQFSGTFLDDGAAYDPAAGTWRELAPAPLGARAPLAVWTGEEMILWGTATRTEKTLTDGAAYDPATDSWREIAEAPIALSDAIAVWTGEEMIVFGAYLRGGNHADTDVAIGAAYDPESNAWRRLPDSSLSPQASTAAWDGTQLVAWDYELKSQVLDPATDTWNDVPEIPLDFGECSPKSVAVGRHVVGHYCGRSVLFDSETGEWRSIDRHSNDRTAVLVGAGDAAIFLGDTPEPWAYAFRPEGDVPGN